MKKLLLKMELHHYEQNVVRYLDFKKLLNCFEICQWLVRIRKSIVYQFVNRVVILVYTLLVFTTTMERTFSHMKIIRTR
jgi:hypothetical protein